MTINSVSPLGKIPDVIFVGFNFINTKKITTYLKFIHHELQDHDGRDSSPGDRGMIQRLEMKEMTRV
jgi:hypothetical protein